MTIGERNVLTPGCIVSSHSPRCFQGKRYVLPNTTIMMHHPSGVARGQASDIQNEARELMRVRNYVNGVLSVATGQEVDTVRPPHCSTTDGNHPHGRRLVVWNARFPHVKFFQSMFMWQCWRSDRGGSNVCNGPQDQDSNTHHCMHCKNRSTGFQSPCQHVLSRLMPFFADETFCA